MRKSTVQAWKRKVESEQKKKQQRVEKTMLKKRERQADFIAPAEPKRGKTEYSSISSKSYSNHNADNDDLEILKQKLKAKGTEGTIFEKKVEATDVSNFVAGGIEKKKKKKKKKSKKHKE